VALHRLALDQHPAPFGFTLDTLVALVFILVETAALVGATISFFFLSRVCDRSAEVEANLAG